MTALEAAKYNKDVPISKNMFPDKYALEAGLQWPKNNYNTMSLVSDSRLNPLDTITQKIYNIFRI